MTPVEFAVGWVLARGIEALLTIVFIVAATLLALWLTRERP